MSTVTMDIFNDYVKWLGFNPPGTGLLAYAGVEALLCASPSAILRGGKGSTVLPLRWLLLPRFDAMLSRRFGLADWKP